MNEPKKLLGASFWFTVVVTIITVGTPVAIWGGKITDHQDTQDKRMDGLQRQVDTTRSQINDDLQHLNDKLDAVLVRLPPPRSGK